jgi:competence protein ComGC
MSIPKLAIVILLLAALLFLVVPNLSWAKCNHSRRGSGESLTSHLVSDFLIHSYCATRQTSLIFIRDQQSVSRD